MTTTKDGRTRGPRAALEASGVPRAAHAVVVGVTVLGALALVVGALAALRAPALAPHLRAPIPGVPLWPATAAFAVVFFLLQKQGFVFHWREESTKVSLDEIALFAGVLFLPGGNVVLGVAASSAVNQWVHRRDPFKAGYNVGQYALSAFLAVFAARALEIAGAAAPWYAAGAPIVFSAATALFVSLLFSRIEGGSVLGVFRARFGGFALVGSSLGVSLGLVVFALFRLHPAAVLAAVPIFLYLRRFGRLSEWADDELKTHKLLASVSAEVAGRSDLDAVADRVLHACHQLLSCGEAQLTLAGEPGDQQRVWRRTFLEGGAGVGGATADVVDADDAVIGSLHVYPRPGQRGYGEREHHLLRTVAANAASAAANAHALKVAQDANTELAASERRYRNLFDTAHVLIHVLDERGRIVDANPAAIATLGFGGAELARRGFEDLLVHGDGEPTGLVEELQVSGEVRGLETQLRTRDGEPVHVLLDAKRLESAGPPARFVVFSRDITALKHLEVELRDANDRQRETIKRLENMNRELEEFTLWTTHDMREPLRSIGTIAGFLLEDLGSISDDEARDMARRICGGAERLKERVKALHAFSRIVQRDDAFEDVDMQRVVEEAASAFETRIREQGAMVVLPREPLPVVRAQPHRIDQVVANLVENALKYGRSDAPVVEVGFEEAGDEWRFFVRDNGPGIPAGYHERIFGLFQRGPDTGEPGSGAGLAIVKRIVEQHGGRAWVRSAPGEGATFWFTLPRAPARAAAPASSPIVVAGPPPPPGPARKPF